MSGKKFYLLLGVLAVASLGISAALTLLTGGGAPAGKPSGEAPTKEAALLAGVTAAGGPPPMLPRQEQFEQLVKELRVKVLDYRRKEQKLAEREKRLALAEENLKRRSKELANLLARLEAPLNRLKAAEAELERARLLVDKQERANIQRIAATFEKMDPEGGGEILSGMCANSQTDDAVKILYYMSDRTSASLLGEMKDRDLAARLAGMMQRITEKG
jgi:flagellar motility protein MotE (MotC chaperone)